MKENKFIKIMLLIGAIIGALAAFFEVFKDKIGDYLDMLPEEPDPSEYAPVADGLNATGGIPANEAFDNLPGEEVVTVGGNEIGEEGEE